MLEDTSVALSDALNGVNEAKRLFADQKLKVDRLMAAGDDAREAQQTLGLLEVYPQFWRHTASTCRDERSYVRRLGDASGPYLTMAGADRDGPFGMLLVALTDLWGTTGRSPAGGVE